MPYEIPHKKERVVIPVTTRDRKIWRKAARAAGLTLAEYARNAINNSVGVITLNDKTNGEKADA